MNGIIYCWTNKNNGKKYIGQTIHPDQRKRNHIHEAFIKGSDYYFHRSLRKNGVEGFSYEVLEENVENLDERENFYINYFNTIWPNGYNQQYAKSLSVSAINKMSETKKRQWLEKSDEEKSIILEQLRTANLGKTQSDYQKQKAAEANRKKWEIELPNGNKIAVQNLKEWCEKENLSTSNMRNTFDGLIETHRGYILRQVGSDGIPFRKGKYD